MHNLRPIYVGQNLIDLAGIQIGGGHGNIYRTDDQIPGQMVWWKSNFVHLSDDPTSDVGDNKSSPRSARCVLSRCIGAKMRVLVEFQLKM